MLMMVKSESDWAPIARVKRAAIVFLGHLLLCVLVVLAVFVIELLIKWLWGANEPLIFDRVPLKWLFQLIDVCILAVFGVAGTLEAFHKLRE
jgi:hypothetical protein